jgi:hypothetical protein
LYYCEWSVVQGTHDIQHIYHYHFNLPPIVSVCRLTDRSADREVLSHRLSRVGQEPEVDGRHSVLVRAHQAHLRRQKGQAATVCCR